MTTRTSSPRSSWLAALLLVVALSTSSSCRSPVDTAAKASKVSRITAEEAMHAWGAYVAEFKPPVEEEKKVQAAFDRYKDAQLTVLDTAIAYKKAEAAGNASDKTAAQKALDIATITAGAAFTDLIEILRGHHVKGIP